MKRSKVFAAALIASAALIAYSFAPAGTASAAAGADGRAVFEAKNCGVCHQTQGTARERTFADQLAKKGPELWYAGSKFKPGFLEGWLAKPEPIRPMAYNSLTEVNKGDHPALGAEDAAAVAGYLMTLTSDDVKAEGIVPKNNPPGRRAFVKKLACYGCHPVSSRGKVVGGVTAPSLNGSSARLNPDWIYAYLTNPGVFQPVSRMPNYNGYLKEAEMRGLAAYVASLL